MFCPWYPESNTVTGGKIICATCQKKNEGRGTRCCEKQVLPEGGLTEQGTLHNRNLSWPLTMGDTQHDKSNR